MTGPTREWVVFDDPKRKRHVYHFDVTYLTSNHLCIFGRGCQGVLNDPTPELSQGCCSYGAHFSDKKDRRKIERIAKTLDPEIWQFAKQGRKKGIAVEDAKDDWRTRLVQGACIFLNRPDFHLGAGCALHVHAMREGVHHSTVKPEVCWQVPLRNIEDYDEDAGDGVVAVERADTPAGLLRARVLLPASGMSEVIEADFKEQAPEYYERLRVYYGLPDGSRDLQIEKSLPLEAYFDQLNAIDWEKGCYVGQELTARTRYRGLVRKHLLPVEIEGELPDFGAPITADGEEVGDMRTSFDGYGIAFLRMEALDKAIDAGAGLTAGQATIRVLHPSWLNAPNGAAEEPAAP